MVNVACQKSGQLRFNFLFFVGHGDCCGDDVDELQDADREFLASFFELPWFIDAIAAFAILHWREAIQAKQFEQVTHELEAWASRYDMFHPSLLPRDRAGVGFSRLPADCCGEPVADRGGVGRLEDRVGRLPGSTNWCWSSGGERFSRRDGWPR
jgi:hypothetical protein